MILMLKDAMQYLLNLNTKPADRVVEIDDLVTGVKKTVVINDDGNAQILKRDDSISKQALLLSTLTSLVDYVSSGKDRKYEDLFIHVEDEETVYLRGTLLDDGNREELVKVKAIIPYFNFDSFLDAEQLNIQLQSKFVQNEDRDILLKVVGNIQEDNVRTTGDNGMAQAVTIKTGVASADDVLVPNPVKLAPYRTFLEVEQPESKFIFRMKDGPRGAIFEADGGAWRNQAIKNIKDYLSAALESELASDRITIIA